jgi:hypothetical protein
MLRHRRLILAAAGAVALATVIVAALAATDGGGDDEQAVVRAGAAADPTPAIDASARTRPGRLVARGEGVTVEVVDMPSATTVYRLTLTSGPYAVRDAAAVVSVDGQALGTARETPDLSALVLLTSDPAVVQRGATIALTYGLPDEAPVAWSATVEPAG